MTTDMPPGSPRTATGAPNGGPQADLDLDALRARLRAENSTGQTLYLTGAPAGSTNTAKAVGTVSQAFLAHGADLQYNPKHPAVANLNTSELTVVQDVQIRRMNATLTTVVQTGNDTKSLLVHMEKQVRSLQTSLRITGILTASIAFVAVAVALAAFNAR